MTAPSSSSVRHIPVMLAEVLAALAPRAGEVYVDGTFGAGGYTSAVLEAADCKVIAIDRDPNAIRDGQAMVANYSGRLNLLHGAFSEMGDLLEAEGITAVDGVMLDIGVSSMQLDEAARGFSFMRDGPLDMRMSQSGPSAADHVNKMDQDDLARVIYILGEEPKSRAIARAIVKAREEQPITTTLELVRAIERATGPQRMKDRTHPATRTFQALRIFVNAELEELATALQQAELLLRDGGRLVVVTFHSLEDRIVKRFLQSRAGKTSGGSRHLFEVQEGLPPSFTLPVKGHIGAGDEEGAVNPRSRSAKLRIGIRTKNAAWPFSFEVLGMPRVEGV